MASPTVLIVGGPNGAGKTTLAEPYAEQKNQSYLAADRIAEEIDPDDPYAVRMAAGRQFLRRLDAFIDDRISFVVESTLAGRGLAQAVDRMNGAGYVTRIAFVFLDSVNRCVRRVQERIRKGGHAVPEEDIRCPLHAEQDELLDVIPPEAGSLDPVSQFRSLGAADCPRRE